MIPYGRQSITPADIDAVIEILQSDFITQGPAVPRFEAAIAAVTGAAHTVATNSATSALHLACEALGVRPGDAVWTSPTTFVASANCARHCGAAVDFVDIDPRTGHMDPNKLEWRLKHADARGELPKVIIPVHLTGTLCDMEAIGALAARYGVRVIEDASHCIGGRDRDAPVGACRYSDVTVFSFHPVKIITTGEGGAATTQNPGLADRMAALRSHGITRDRAKFACKARGPWYYEQHALGFNYRLTDLQAALGTSQMARLPATIGRRLALARRYDTVLSDLPVTPLRRPANERTALHLYVVRLQLQRISVTHAEVHRRLRTAGIGANLHYFPVHLQPYYRQFGFGPGMFPEAERYGGDAVTLPLYPELTETEQDQVVDALRSVLS